MKMQWLVALSLIAFVTPSMAQKVYTWTAEDGSTVYSDQPPPPGVTGQEFTPSTSTVVEQNRAQRSRLLRESRDISRRTDEKIRRRENLQQELQAARQALADAREALESGLAPQPGELRRNVSGGTWRDEAYFERVKGLERKVAEAEARVAELSEQLERVSR